MSSVIDKECSAAAECTSSETEVHFQKSGQQSRTLTTKEQHKLDQDIKLVSDFKQMKLEKEAQKNWDLFYKRNTTKFFKDRHWTTREFDELCGKVRMKSE